MFMKNEFAFLSNYYPCTVEYKGLVYDSSEAAFQAQKTINELKKKEFCGISPNEAKRLGRRIDLRNDWESIKDLVMYEVVKAKFSQNEDFKALLLQVKEPIVEDNTWNDTYWGVCNGVGQNKLGKILEKIKMEFKNDLG